MIEIHITHMQLMAALSIFAAASISRLMLRLIA